MPEITDTWGIVVPDPKDSDFGLGPKTGPDLPGRGVSVRRADPEIRITWSIWEVKNRCAEE